MASKTAKDFFKDFRKQVFGIVQPHEFPYSLLIHKSLVNAFCGQTEDAQKNLRDFYIEIPGSSKNAKETETETDTGTDIGKEDKNTTIKNVLGLRVLNVLSWPFLALLVIKVSCVFAIGKLDQFFQSLRPKKVQIPVMSNLSDSLNDSPSKREPTIAFKIIKGLIVVPFWLLEIPSFFLSKASDKVISGVSIAAKKLWSVTKNTAKKNYAITVLISVGLFVLGYKLIGAVAAFFGGLNIFGLSSAAKGSTALIVGKSLGGTSAAAAGAVVSSKAKTEELEEAEENTQIQDIQDNVTSPDYDGVTSAPTESSPTSSNLTEESEHSGDNNEDDNSQQEEHSNIHQSTLTNK